MGLLTYLRSKIITLVPGGGGGERRWVTEVWVGDTVCMCGWVIMALIYTSGVSFGRYAVLCR